MRYVLGSLALTIAAVVIISSAGNYGEIAEMLYKTALMIGAFSLMLVFPQQITVMLPGMFIVNRAANFMFAIGKRAFQIALGAGVAALGCAFVAGLLEAA